MQVIRTIQKVDGPILTVSLPEGFEAKQVEIIVLPLDGNDANQPLPPGLDPRYSRFVVPKPPMTEQEKKLFEENPYPLRGSVIRYDDPLESAVPDDDWEVYQGDSP